MAKVDLEAIRKRIAQLNGEKTATSSVQMWKPTIGKHEVRGLPWKNSTDGMPFKELWFYYIGDNPGVLSLKQFGEPDPINEFISKLYDSGKPEDRELAKSMRAKMRSYMPVIVRGQEDKGVQIWAFGSPLYKRLLSFYGEEDVGDILDPVAGFDLKVTVSQQPGKMFKGKPSLDTMVDAARSHSKLSADPEQAKKWLDSVPDINDMWKKKSYKELEGILTTWLNGGAPVESQGASRGPAPKDNLDELSSELKETSHAEAKKEEPAKKPAAKAKGKEDKKSSLDEAFDELMDN